MHKITSLRVVLSFVVLFSLLGVFCYELFYAKPTELPSALIGEELPAFSLPSLSGSTLRSDDLRGQVSLLNVWASWCAACSIEAPVLMSIHHDYHVPIYGIAYKDTVGDAKHWLAQYGNPFTSIGLDASGDVGIDLGVYGTPETFIVNPQGKIVYRHVGVVTQQVWLEVLLPIVRRYQSGAVT
jgi:cytochrome c biogenesis protein CcmG/thiol:disulfide interchange protein DsbE